MSVIYASAAEVDARLARLGLTVEDIRAAVERAEAYARDCTENDPATTSGYLRWAKTVRHLRERLIPQGWTRGRTRNFETVVDPRARIGLAVSSADEGVADPARTPRTANSKGTVTHGVVGANYRQLALDLPAVPRPRSATDPPPPFPDPPLPFPDLDVDPAAGAGAGPNAGAGAGVADPGLGEGATARETWFVLYCRTPDALRVEVALPDAIGQDDRIDSWSERILLPVIPLDDDVLVTAQPEAEIPIEVPVRRRVG